MTFHDHRDDITLAELTGGADLRGHDRRSLLRMRWWCLKGMWPACQGPRPGQPGCEVELATQALFDDFRSGHGGQGNLV